jgi:S1-C subfamily serine protease
VGVQPVPLAGTLSEAAKSLTHGLLILAAEAETPAGRAGLLVGDILLSLDNTPVRDPMDLRHFLAGRNPGDKIRIGLLRGGERKELDVELGERDRRH